MWTILLATLIFLLIIWLVIFILLWARKRLLPDKKVKIVINGERELEAESGGSLLQTLANEEIFVASACGGSGTCGACKGKILAGGGELLPTEKMHIDRRMEQDHQRLFCQVKVKNDLEIEIPPAVFGVKKWECKVLSNCNIATYMKELVLQMPDNEVLNFQSGSYVQLDIPKYKLRFDAFDVAEKYRAEWESFGLFSMTAKNSEPTTRAYSLASYPAENQQLRLNVRLALPPFDAKKERFKALPAGVASSWIFSLKAGDKVQLSGPYGDFFIRESDREMVFIGGGAGMAPMRSHLFQLFKNEQTKRKVSFWYGARSTKELFYVADFQELAEQNPNFSMHVALSEAKAEKGWNGNVGFIHEVLYEHYLKNHPAPEEAEYYICGPKLMLTSVLTLLDELGVPQNLIFFDDFSA